MHVHVHVHVNVHVHGMCTVIYLSIYLLSRSGDEQRTIQRSRHLRGGGDSRRLQVRWPARRGGVWRSVGTHSDARGLPAPTHTADQAQRGGPPACLP